VEENKHLKLEQMYGYEKGKNQKNIETVKQMEIIKEMFERYVKDRLENGKWSETHFKNIKQNIEEAFDNGKQRVSSTFIKISKIERVQSINSSTF
jgi:hypothetical protein